MGCRAFSRGIASSPVCPGGSCGAGHRYKIIYEHDTHNFRCLRQILGRFDILLEKISTKSSVFSCGVGGVTYNKIHYAVNDRKPGSKLAVVKKKKKKYMSIPLYSIKIIFFFSFIFLMRVDYVKK